MASSWEDPPEYRPESFGGPQVAFPRMTRGTRSLLIANSVIFVASFIVYYVSNESWGGLVRWLGVRPASWRELFPFVPVWQVLTYGFLHETRDLFHLLMNMLVLYFFGTMLEGMIGTRRFLIAYFSAQVAGALLFLAQGVFTGGRVAAIGASGAVYGVMIAMATLRPRQMVLVLFIPVTLRILALVILAITVFGAAMQLKGEGGDGVAHLVHLGGIVYGFLAVKTGLLFADPVAALERSRRVREGKQKESDEARVDQILAKINREGMASLSRSEREFLKRVSSRR